MPDKLKVATGIVHGASASPALVTAAVNKALSKAGLSAASSVLLLLTSEFAAEPQSAIKAASKAASTTQVFGCSATGIFTEDEWVLDGAAVAAMVFSHDILSSTRDAISKSKHLLTLAAPSAIDSRWLASTKVRFGGVSGDATGRGPFSVWQNGKGNTQGYCELGLQQCTLALAPSHGLKTLSSPRRITACNTFDLVSIANIPALLNLKSTCTQALITDEFLPIHKLMMAYAKTAKAMERGEYQLSSIILTNDDTQTITLSNPPREGDWMCWMLRDVASAQTDIVKTANQLKDSLNNTPDFALLFSCLGRGPYFYDGNDLDLALLKTLLPKLPIIGFYGNGEIAPILGKNTLLQYSAVLALFASTKAHT